MSTPPKDDPNRRRDPFDDFFRGLGMDPSQFDRLFDEMQKALGRMLSEGGPLEPGKPYMHGFSFKMGPDGKPHIVEFGNRPNRDPAKKNVTLSDEREPLTDVIESAKDIAVTVEMPGVEKNDIDLHVTKEECEITVDAEHRKYHKAIKLPSRVKPETTKATYKNGILDIVIQKEAQGQPKGGLKVKVD
jgi:HSP20 family protein